jgi:hypothetical protein
MHPVLTQSKVVGCIDKCNVMVVIHTDSRSALTAPSMPHMSSLSETFLVNFIFSLYWVFSLICKQHDDIVLINCQSTWFGDSTVHMARMTLADAQKNYDVSQYSQ